jgi:hypothetical protein
LKTARNARAQKTEAFVESEQHPSSRNSNENNPPGLVRFGTELEAYYNTGFDNRKEDEVCTDFVFGRSDGAGMVSVPPHFLSLNLGQGSHGGAETRRTGFY